MPTTGLGSACRSEAGAAAAQRLSASDFAATVEGLRAGKSAAEMLDDRFLAAFAIAGTAEDCLAQVRAYLEAGATELALSFAGPQPEQDMQYLGRALLGRRVGKIATGAAICLAFHGDFADAIESGAVRVARRAQRVCRADSEWNARLCRPYKGEM